MIVNTILILSTIALTRHSLTRHMRHALFEEVSRHGSSKHKLF